MEKDHKNHPEQLKNNDVVSRAYDWIQVWSEGKKYDPGKLRQEWNDIKNALLVFPGFEELTKETRDVRWGDTLIGVVDQIEEEKRNRLTPTASAVNTVVQQIRDSLERLGGKDVVSCAYTWIQKWCEAKGCDSRVRENMKEALREFPMLEELDKETRDARWGDTLIGVVEQIERESGRRDEK